MKIQIQKPKTQRISACMIGITRIGESDTECDHARVGYLESVLSSGFLRKAFEPNPKRKTLNSMNFFVIFIPFFDGSESRSTSAPKNRRFRRRNTEKEREWHAGEEQGYINKDERRILSWLEITPLVLWNNYGDCHLESRRKERRHPFCIHRPYSSEIRDNNSWSLNFSCLF